MRESDPSAPQPVTTPPPAARGRIFGSVIETIGATPMIRLSRLAADEGIAADIVGKCEFYNPLSSVKDRIGLAMIEAEERLDGLGPDSLLVEPTSGNTGIALAFVCAAKGYRLILAMPESMSSERRKMLRLLGAELELTPAERGMAGAIARAEEIVAKTPGAVMLQQFRNRANPDIHQASTAEEIWTDSGGAVDMVIGGIGTGGTLTGIGRALKPRKPGLRIVGVEPEDSAVLSGRRAGAHQIEGIGAGFVPPVLDREMLDEVLSVANETAFATARRTARLEGLPVGISSGAALSTALEIGARPEMAGRMIVVILPSFAERYLSTPLFDDL